MSAMQQPTANHQSKPFGSGQTQFFECEALSADHPEIQARERARQQRMQLSNPTERQPPPNYRLNLTGAVILVFRASTSLQTVQRRKATRKDPLMSEQKTPGKLAHAKGTQKSTKSTTKQTAKKAAAQAGPRADKADVESTVLAQIAAMPEPDRVLGERPHAIIKASAPALSPRLWYGMPAYTKDGKVVCFFQSAQKFKTTYATFGFMHDSNLTATMATRHCLICDIIL